MSGPVSTCARVGAEEEAAHAQVEDEARLDAQVRVEDRRRLRLLEPRDDGRAVRERRQPARLAEGVVGEAGVDAVEPLERLPGRGLAHRDVGVAGRALRPHAEFVTLTARRAPTSAKRRAISSSSSGKAAW